MHQAVQLTEWLQTLALEQVAVTATIDSTGQLGAIKRRIQVLHETQQTCSVRETISWKKPQLQAFRPKAQAMIVSQYNKIMTPASFSPLK